MHQKAPRESIGEAHPSKKLMRATCEPPLPRTRLHTNVPYRELVRQRRNYMERKRMHAKKDIIESMQKTVRELERKYDVLCANAKNGVNTELTTSEQPLHRRRDHTNQQSEAESASLHALVKQIHMLIRENNQVRNLIDQHISFQQCVGSIMQETKLEKTITSTLQFKHYSKFCYVPFTMDECYALIRKDLAQHVLTNKPDFFDPVVNKHLMFGWHGFIKVERSNAVRRQVYFQMTKEWPGVPEGHCKTMWQFDIQETDPNHVYMEHYCLEILQHISDDIKVARRRVPWEGHTSWSVFLTYRTRVGNAYLIGTVPLPLWGKGSPTGASDAYGESFLDEKEAMSLLPLHHMFVPVVKENGAIHTRLFRWGITACQKEVFMSLFEQCVLESALRYEKLVLFPVVNLLET